MEANIHNRADEQGAKVNGFYPEPERVQCLNFLLHLAPYSDGVLQVIGATGSGKTTLLKQFQAKAIENWRICSLEASQLETLSAFLRDIQQGFGFSFHGATDLLSKVNALVEHFGVMHKRGQKPILIIDEAHLLLPDIAEFLDKLLAELVGDHKGRMSLVLLAESKLTEQPWYENIARHGIHNFALNPLDFDETSRLVLYIIECMGLPSSSLSQSQLKTIFKQARGNLGASKTVLSSIIGSNQGQTIDIPLNHTEVKPSMTNDKPETGKKPIKFSRILFAMLTVLMVLALYYEDEINEFFEPTESSKVTQSSQVITKTPGTGIVEPTRIEIPPTVEVLEPLSLDDAGEEVLLTEETSDPFEEETLVSEASEVTSVEEKVTSDEEIVSKPLDDTPVIEEVVTTPSLLESSTAEVAVKVEEEPKALATEAPLEVDDSGMIRRESWVLEQNPEHYTLQIMSFSQELGIAKALSKVQSRESFFYFKYKKDGKIWYRLAYGAYPDREAAVAASKALPKELGKVNPWIRRVGDVQKEITSQ